MPSEGAASAGRIRHSVGGNFIALLLGEAVARGFTFAASLYLARQLGVENFGLVELTLAVVVYVQLVVEGGLDTVATRAVARRPVDRLRFADNLAGMRLALVGAAVLIVGTLTYVWPMLPLTRYLIIGFSLAAVPAAFNLGWSFQAQARMRIVAIAGALTQATYLALLLWLVHGAADVGRVPLAFGAAALVGPGVLAWRHRRRFGPVRPRANRAFWSATTVEAMPILGARLLRAVSFNFDVLLIGAISSTTAVAYYAAAYRFVLIPVLGFAAFFSALFPVLVTAGEAQRTRLVRLVLIAVVVTSIAAAAGLTLIATPLLTLAMGAPFAPAAGALRWLAWSIPFIAVAGVFRQVLLVRHLQRVDLAAVAVGAVLNVLLNLLLVPHFGVTGAAVATIAGEAAVLVAAITGLALVSPHGVSPELAPALTPAGQPGVGA